jgi:large subunit ribosomal protein L10
MHKTEKERVVAELTEQLRSTDSLIVADYRGLTNGELQELRLKLRPHGARLTVVKNTLTRRAAEAAGAEAVLTLLDGPTAIAFVEADGDPVAVAKALADTARQTKVMTLRGGVLQGSPISGEEVESLAKLPPMDVLRGQLVGVIVAPLTQLLGLLTAPLRDLVGVIDARIVQLEEQGDTSGAVASAPTHAVPAEADVVEDDPEAEATEAAEAPPVEASAEAEDAPDDGADADANDTENNEEE